MAGSDAEDNGSDAADDDCSTVAVDAADVNTSTVAVDATADAVLPLPIALLPPLRVLFLRQREPSFRAQQARACAR